MDIKWSEGKVALDKELNVLDRFVLDFASMLDAAKIRYVVISGYVSILLGRTRTTEDVDVFIEKWGARSSMLSANCWTAVGGR
jgi:predicted nucleotidyltransferase